MSRIGVALCLALALAERSFALEGRVLFPDGNPASNLKVAVIGRPGSVRTDQRGVFRFEPTPRLPAELVVAGPRGEIYPSFTVDAVPEAGLEIVLAPVHQESVTVVPAVAPNIHSSPAAATAILANERLRERPSQRVVDILSGTAGVSGNDGGAPAVPVIRGMRGGRTLIVLDGARVATERRAGASATFVDAFALGSVEVARGPGSVAYGSDALGGVILLRSRDPVPGESSVRFDLGTTEGATNTTHAGVEIAQSLTGNTAALLTLHGRRSGDAEAGGGEAIPWSSFRDAGGAIRIVSDLSAGRFRLGYAIDEGRDIGKPERDSARVRNIYPTESSGRATFSWEASALGNWSGVELSGFVGRYRLVLDRDFLQTGEAERSDVAARDASLRLVGQRPLGSGSLRTGLELVGRFGLRAITDRSEFAVRDAQRWDSGAFMLYDRPIDPRVLLSVGARVDTIRTENRGGYFGDHSTENLAFSGHAGLTAAIFPRLTASAQIARGFRDPTLSDRYFRGVSGRGFVTGNPDLDPEKSLQLDGALRWDHGRSSLALFAYWYRIEDVIERYRHDGDFFFRNHGTAIVRGLEVEGSWKLTANLLAELALSSATGQIRPDGVPLDGISSPGGRLNLRWGGAGRYALARITAFAEHDDPGATEVPLSGYTTFDIGFGWRYGERTELRVYASNVSDRRYYASADEIAPLASGRSVSIAIAGEWPRR